MHTHMLCRVQRSSHDLSQLAVVPTESLFCNQTQNPPASSFNFSTPGIPAGWAFTPELTPKEVGLQMDFSPGAMQPFATGCFAALKQFEVRAAVSSEHVLILTGD